jgi:hypothetical protein
VQIRRTCRGAAHHLLAGIQPYSATRRNGVNNSGSFILPGQKSVQFGPGTTKRTLNSTVIGIIIHGDNGNPFEACPPYAQLDSRIKSTRP